MRFAVVGVGAIGGYFGARLVEAGNDVAFVARGTTLAALKENGLRLESPKGNFVAKPVFATSHAKEIGSVDVVLLGVKTWQVSKAAKSIKPLLGERTCVLPLQNGVEAPQELATALGPDRALGGLCWMLSSLVAPGHIRHIGVEPSIVFGELNNTRSERVKELLTTLQAAGIQAHIPPNIQAAMWEKFLFICSVSGIGAITRATIGEIRQHRETRAMLEQSMREIAAVARGHNIRLPEKIVEERMAFVDKLPKEGTASMQRDLIDGRPSELEAQNGAVVRLGRQVGVNTPLNEFIYHALLLSEIKSGEQAG